MASVRKNVDHQQNPLIRRLSGLLAARFIRMVTFCYLKAIVTRARDFFIKTLLCRQFCLRA